VSNEDLRTRLSLLDETSGRELASAAVAEGVGKWDYSFQVDAGPDGRNVYFCHRERGAYRWDSTAGVVDHLFTQTARIGGLVVRGDERLLATLAGKSALLWDLPDGKKKLELKHSLICSGAAFLPNGRLMTACYDGLVRIWDLSGGSEIQAMD